MIRRHYDLWMQIDVYKKNWLLLLVSFKCQLTYESIYLAINLYELQNKLQIEGWLYSFTRFLQISARTRHDKEKVK